MAETEWSTIEPGSPPEQEKVEFEIEGQEATEEVAAAPEVEVEAEAKVETETPQEETTPTIEEEQEQETKGVETSGAQKRIRQLVKQKKEREAQIEELLAQQKEMQIKLQQREEEYKNLLSNNVESNERQVTERLELARAAYRQAVESGDADNILKAQESLNTAQQDNYRLTEFRQQADSFEPQKFEKQQQVQAAATVSDAQRKATNWAAANEWFNKDRVMTAVALEIDNQVQEEGFDPSDDDYYQEIDRRMAAQFPNKFGQATKEVATETPVPQETSTPAQVVAGASHTPAPSSSKKVKLSQEDVRLAEKWGISLEQYAAEKLKVEKAGEGEYTTINR